MIHFRKAISSFVFTMLLWGNGAGVYGQMQKDTLKTKSYKELSDFFYKYEVDSSKVLPVAYEYLKRAKEEKDTVKIADGFYYLSTVYKNTGSLLLKYYDSIIQYISKLITKSYPFMAYFKKGDYYYSKRLYYKALENYLMAEKSTLNSAYKNGTKHRIGILKSRYGNDDEALVLFKESFKYSLEKYYNKTFINDHLIILYALTDSYLRNKKIDSAIYFCNQGYKMSVEFNKPRLTSYFIFEKGLIELENHNYQAAIDSITKTLPTIEKDKDLENLSYSYYSIAKSYEKLGTPDSALAYYKKVDSVFQISKDIHPDVRETYEYFINYYHEKNDLNRELTYIKRLLKVDSVLYHNYKTVNKLLVKNYDTPKLLSQKDEVIARLQKRATQRDMILYISYLLILLISVVAFYQYRKRKVYKKRFEEIIRSKKTDKVHTVKEKLLNVPEETVKEILKGLDIFEKEREYRSTTLSLNMLARKLNTNTSYLSKIINHYKGVSFSNYVNLLRIEYAIDELKNNSQLRGYTIEAIAGEVGFSNAESFSKAFYRLKGIRPSYFLRELVKIENKN